MGWFALFLFLLLLLIPTLILGWALFNVSKLRYRKVEGKIVSPDDIPEVHLEGLKGQVEPLLSSGFEYQGMRIEKHGERDYYQAILSSVRGAVWAIAEESSDGLQRRGTLYSFSEEGDVVATRDGSETLGDQLVGELSDTGSFESAFDQASVHAAKITKNNVKALELTPHQFLEGYEAVSRDGVETMLSQGWLSKIDGKLYQVNWSGRFRLALAWLVSKVVDWREKRKATSWVRAIASPLNAIAEPESEAIKEAAKAEADAPLPVGDSSGLALTDELPVLSDEGLVDIPEQKSAINPLASEAMPVGEIEQKKTDVLKQVTESLSEEKASTPAKEAVPASESVESPVKEEEKLPEDPLQSDIVRYQRQQGRPSFRYWLEAHLVRVVIFLALLFFALFKLKQGEWSSSFLLYLFGAYLFHEAGHALFMLLRRSWDSSYFLFPIPRPLVPKFWAIEGGGKELFTILAGPVPGLFLGWAVLIGASFGLKLSDQVLDIAYAAVLFNSAMMLPLRGFDGGRLLDLIFFRKHPVFAIFCLVVLGLILFLLAFLTKNWLFAIFGLIYFLDYRVFASRRKVLPWMSSNQVENEFGQLQTNWSIVHQQKRQKLFRKIPGIVRFDRISGLARAKGVGFFGLLVALGVFALALLLPWVVPGRFFVDGFINYGSVFSKDGDKVNELLGELPEVVQKPADDTSLTGKALMTQLEDWESSLAKNSFEQVFADQEDLIALRKLPWREVAHWVAEAPASRQVVPEAAIEVLCEQAKLATDAGNGITGIQDLSYAMKCLHECEPRGSLDSWFKWFDLERKVLKEVENVSARHSLKDSHLQWFERAFALCSKPSGKKFAGLLLADEGVSSFKDLANYESLGRFTSSISKPSLDFKSGKSYLESSKLLAGVFPTEIVEEKSELADKLSKTENWEQAIALLRASDPQLVSISSGALDRFEENYEFRQIAITAFVVKRLGLSGAARERRVLLNYYNYHSRISGQSLKLNRYDKAGNVTGTAEWLLQASK